MISNYFFFFSSKKTYTSWRTASAAYLFHSVFLIVPCFSFLSSFVTVLRCDNQVRTLSSIARASWTFSKAERCHLHTHLYIVYQNYLFTYLNFLCIAASQCSDSNSCIASKSTSSVLVSRWVQMDLFSVVFFLSCLLLSCRHSAMED